VAGTTLLNPSDGADCDIAAIGIISGCQTYLAQFSRVENWRRRNEPTVVSYLISS
jgi:hypothetical protein